MTWLVIGMTKQLERVTRELAERDELDEPNETKHRIHAVSFSKGSGAPVARHGGPQCSGGRPNFARRG